MCGAVRDLGVESEEVDARVEGLAGFGGETDDFKPGRVNLFGQLVDCDVGWGADEDLARIHLGEVIDDGSGRDGLAGSRRPLDKAEWLLEDALDGVHLRVIELGETRC